RLRDRGFSAEEIDRASAYLIEELRRGLASQADLLAEKEFKNAVSEGHFQFRLRTDDSNWEVPQEIPTRQPETAPLLYRSSDAKPVQLNLFEPTYRDDFNSVEAEFACYLDEANAMSWWFRNVARATYALQGWRRDRVYPDFVFGVRKDAVDQLVVLETKGDHLGGQDTTYKRELLSVLSDAYSRETVTAVGSLEVQI